MLEKSDHLQEYLKALTAGVEQKAEHKLQVEVRLRNVEFTASASNLAPDIRTVLNSNPVTGPLIKGLRALKEHGAPKSRKIEILSHVDARFVPRTLSLVIGPPASGKTSLLKLVAGEVPRHQKHCDLSFDEVSYNGRGIYDQDAFLPSKLAAYVDQIDTHIPSLTVRQTLEFAFLTYGGGVHVNVNKKMEQALEKQYGAPSRDPRARRSVPPGGPRSLARSRGPLSQRRRLGLDPEVSESRVGKGRYAKVERIMALMGIDHVADTIVGNATTRGVSGGQRRRVTVAEGLMGCGRIFCGDEISTGLDSRTTFEIVRELKVASQVLAQGHSLSGCHT